MRICISWPFQSRLKPVSRSNERLTLQVANDVRTLPLRLTLSQVSEYIRKAPHFTQMRRETKTSGNTRHSAIQVASKICL